MIRFAVMLGVFGLAVPAAAQITDRGWTPGRPGPALSGIARGADWSTEREVRGLFDRIDEGRDAGTLTRREARSLRRSARLIGVSGRRYARDGLTDSERRDLTFQAMALGEQVSLQRLRGAARRPAR